MPDWLQNFAKGLKGAGASSTDVVPPAAVELMPAPTEAPPSPHRTAFKENETEITQCLRTSQKTRETNFAQTQTFHERLAKEAS